MKVKIVKCSCSDSSFSPSRYWYHDKIGEVFDVDVYDADIYIHDNNHYMLISDCVDITKSYMREEKLNKLGIE